MRSMIYDLNVSITNINQYSLSLINILTISVYYDSNAHSYIGVPGDRMEA